MKFAVIPNKYKDPDGKFSGEIAKKLEKAGHTATLLTTADGKDLKACDFAVALGGDGTILEVAKKAAAFGVPVIGVNLGRIGYLASIEPDHTDRLLTLEDGYFLQKRMMLTLTYRGETYNALNDVVISEQRATRMMVADVEANGYPVDRYRATALVFSTPTGSSGFNYSARGPVCDPSLECILLTPVCPHSGVSCGAIYGSDTVFTVKNTSPEDKRLLITVDGNTDLEFDNGECITVTRCEQSVRLIKFDNEPFAHTLTKKLKL